MRCIVLVRATPESESETGAMPGAAVMAAIDRFNAELVQAGVMLAVEGLRPSREGRRVRIAADSPGDTEAAEIAANARARADRLNATD